MEESSISRPTNSTPFQDHFHEAMVEEFNAIDVAEICSPPRVVQYAKEFGLTSGWSLDLQIADEDGRPWDSTKKEMR